MASAKKKARIMFVCTGNTCRSAMAEYIFRDALKKSKKDEMYAVCSSGVYANTGDDMPVEAKLALDKLQIKYKKHKSKRTTRRLIDSATLVVAMTKQHKELIGADSNCKTIGEICGGGDVSDPYGKDEQAYQKCAEYIKYACEDLISYLEKNE